MLCIYLVLNFAQLFIFFTKINQKRTSDDTIILQVVNSDLTYIRLIHENFKNQISGCKRTANSVAISSAAMHGCSGLHVRPN